MRVTFFGTRGSLPVPGPKTVGYGGNTSCVLVETNSGTKVVLDMGSGAYALGQQLAETGGSLRGHVLISHTHWDHIQGFPFFAPFFRPGSTWDVYAPRTVGPSLRQALAGQMQHTYFPLELDEFAAAIRYHDVVEGRFVIDDVTIDTAYLNHTALTLGYRLHADGATIVYALDHEPHASTWSVGEENIGQADEAHVAFVHGADLLIHDAQYTLAEYASKKGWGHSPVEYAIRVAQLGQVRKLALSHHDPQRTDRALDRIVEYYGPRARAMGIELVAAAEGLTLAVEPNKDVRNGLTLAHATSGSPGVLDAHVFVVGHDAARTAGLAEICTSDGLTVDHFSPNRITSALQRRPSLLIVVAPIDKDGLDRCADLVGEMKATGDPPVVVVVYPQGTKPMSAPGLDDAENMTEPYSRSYARARIRASIMRRACRWERPRIPHNELHRLAALHELGVLDRPPDEKLSALVEAARDVFDVPIAAVTLVDEGRQWFCASKGLTVHETSRDESFCAHVVGDPGPLVVSDALLDDRFADNPAVTGPIRIRSYAGHPLILSNGHCIGTFCVADVRPKHFTQEGLRHLARFAELARSTLEERT